MTGLSYYILGQSEYKGIDRAMPCEFRSPVSAMVTVSWHFFIYMYRNQGHPLGKSRRGCKKWCKNRLKQTFQAK